jgi:ABC-type polysaccharide/polyol phosphate export permease
MSTMGRIVSRLTMQGFACEAAPGIVACAGWLRFTPALSTLCIATGTGLRSPAVLWGFAVIAAVGAAGWNVFDEVFNRLVRHLVGAAPLPANPAPRRFAMAVAAAWSAGVGALLAGGFTWAGLVAGGALAMAGATVVTTHFCLGSWLYRMLQRLRRG